MSESEDAWFESEKQAILGDRQSVLECISALRRYRQASKKLLDARYSDGECDGCTVFNFADEVQSIENFYQDQD